jgi:DNA-binding transcriptional LysR family regulator
VIDLVVRDRLGDLVAEGFDLAIRFGEPDVSTLITRKLLDTRVVTAAAPSYLARRGRPRHPRDVAGHECIQFRNPATGQPYEWIFVRKKTVVRIKAEGRLIVNDSATGVAALLAGHGIAQPLELELRGLKEHALVDLFPDWSGERFPLYVYFPSRRLVPAKVRALIDFVVATTQA